MEKKYDKEYYKKYYQKNKEKLKEKAAKWSAENKEKANAYKRKWDAAHKEENKERLDQWKATLKGYLSRKIYHLKKAKRARTLEVQIQVEDLLDLWEKQQGRCAISKYPMTYPETSLFSISVDRIDSGKGYLKENVQLVCQGINFAKNSYSNQEMIEFWNYRTSGEGMAEEEAG